MTAFSEELRNRSRDAEYRARAAAERAEAEAAAGHQEEAVEERLAGVAFLAVAITCREIAEALDAVEEAA